MSREEEVYSPFEEDDAEDNYSDGDFEEDVNKAGNNSEQRNGDEGEESPAAATHDKKSPSEDQDKKSSEKNKKSPAVESDAVKNDKKSPRVSRSESPRDNRRYTPVSKIKQNPEAALAKVLQELKAHGINLIDVLPNLKSANSVRAKSTAGRIRYEDSGDGNRRGGGRNNSLSPTTKSPSHNHPDDGDAHSSRNGSRTPGSPRGGSQTPGKYRPKSGGVSKLKNHQQYDSKTGYFGYGGVDDKTIYQEHAEYYAAKRALKEQKAKEEREFYASRASHESVFGHPVVQGKPTPEYTPAPLPGRLRGQENRSRSSSPRYRTPDGKLRTSMGTPIGGFTPKAGSLAPWPDPEKNNPEHLHREVSVRAMKEQKEKEEIEQLKAMGVSEELLSPRSQTSGVQAPGHSTPMPTNPRRLSSNSGHSIPKLTSMGSLVLFTPKTGAIPPLPEHEQYNPKLGLFGFGPNGKKDTTDGTESLRSGASDHSLPVLKPERFVPSVGPLEVHSNPSHTIKVQRANSIDESEESSTKSPRPPSVQRQGSSVRRQLTGISTS